MSVTAAALVMLGGCEDQATPPAPASTASSSAPASATVPPQHQSERAATTPSPAGPHDAALILREWRKAANREQCAPLAFTSLGGTTATVRRANFGGGWSVAYDQPSGRSAFGLAGTGLLDEDAEAVPEQRARLARQWPRFRELDNLPLPSFAGYGVEGAESYPDENPDGKGLNSLAYVRVGGQRCTYNVWSRLGRAHLEHLLENLTVIEP